MCYQLIERYSACRCLYYLHAVDRCPDFGQPGHDISTRTILIGYACIKHTPAPWILSQAGGVVSARPAPTSEILQRPTDNKSEEVHNDKFNLDSSGVDNLAQPDEQSLLWENNHESELESGSDSSELWDNESNASASSMSTVDPDVVSMAFQRLANYGNLRWFWSKVIIRSGSMKRGCHTVERFLRRYADDLGTWADNPINNQHMSYADRRVRVSACRFIRRSRFNLAERICQMHCDRTSTSESRLEKDSEYGFLLDITEREEEEEPDEPNFAYSLAEDFLFETEPIRKLELNIYTFLQSSDAQTLPTTIRGTAEQYLDRFLSYLQKPSLSKGNRRLSWTCKCGRIIRDNYTELQPGALDRLQELLQQYGKIPETAALNDAGNAPNSNPSAKAGSFPRFSWQQLKAGLSNKNKSHKLPHQHQDKGTYSKFGTCSKSSISGPMSHMFVLMCIPFRRWGTKLQQEDICDIKSDQQFFRALNFFYRTERGRSNWARPKRVISINFVQFEVFRSHLVDVKPGDSIPPLGQPGSDYIFEPVDSLPPIGSNMLMHLLSHPEDADSLPVLYSRIPKKLRLKLEACPIKGSSIGWGVQFVEGLDWSILFRYGCIGFAICLVAAISWAVPRNDVQGGFAIAGFMVAFCMFCVGVIGHESKVES
ncbi:uncharacterized protein GGS22DRAFT_167176 [Annulohypoxylon maeteangense]|uniref:uncharacterized protein n=1 Tax=Annulohypoxylon maeteangense TaxID=1927788 RepID=UPI0020086A7E|nr:uncharacterized protein GGS22DRAFT_167176 [Annulohypoxylon maeteangense]KAI0883508.1 hypothetical protein GGS22DRAFT_167176 [Annulohypoxylon maeteangense]